MIKQLLNRFGMWLCSAELNRLKLLEDQHYMEKMQYKNKVDLLNMQLRAAVHVTEKIFVDSYEAYPDDAPVVCVRHGVSDYSYKVGVYDLQKANDQQEFVHRLAHQIAHEFVRFMREENKYRWTR